MIDNDWFTTLTSEPPSQEWLKLCQAGFPPTAPIYETVASGSRSDRQPKEGVTVPINPFVDLFKIAMQTRALLNRGRGKKMGANYLSRHVAEEVGECIGAHNRYVDGRGTRGQFEHEWAQAMTNLVMLGAAHLTRRQMAQALRDALEVQRRRWASSRRAA